MGSMRKSQLSKAKQDRLIECLVRELQFVAQLILSVKIQKQRFIIFIDYNKSLLIILSRRLTRFSVEIEVGESYFGGKRKGMRGPDALEKVLTLGFLKRRGKIYMKVIADALSTT